MPCAEIHLLLAARRELPWGQERLVQEHLAACAACAARWAREERALQGLRSVPTPELSAAPAPGRRLRDALERGRRPRSYARPLALAAALCGLAALLLLNVRLPWRGADPTVNLPITETTGTTLPLTSTPPAPTPQTVPTVEPAVPSTEEPPAPTEAPRPPEQAAPSPTPEVLVQSPTPEPSAVAPAARPGLLAFRGASLEDRSGSLLVVDPTSGDKLLAVENADPMSWTIDGQGLIFGRCLAGQLSPTEACHEYDLFMADLRNGAETRLTESGTGKGDADAAYDGENLVYAGCTDSECQTMDLIFFNMAGRRTRALGLKMPSIAKPAWSPNSYEVAFYGCPEEHFCREHSLYIQHADGRPLRKLADRALADAAPAWSPDGTRIAFIAMEGEQLEVAVVNADGSGETRLTSSAAREFSPSWSPDGRHIVYIAMVDAASGGNYESDIYVMRADGSAQTRLTSSPGPDYAPTWSPDGQLIAFVSGRPPGSWLNMQLFLIRPDGSGEVQVTPYPYPSLDPMWAPQ